MARRIVVKRSRSESPGPSTWSAHCLELSLLEHSRSGRCALHVEGPGDSERDRFTTIRLAMYNVDIYHVVTQRLLSQPISDGQLTVGTVLMIEQCRSVLL